MFAPIRLRVRSTVDLLAIVPYLLGFHPAESLVVVATRGRQITFAARADLPDAAASAAARASFTDHLVSVVIRQQVDAVSVIGYGPADRVATAMRAAGEAFTRCGVRIVDRIRVDAGRYWSYLCSDPACCPPDGTPFDLSTNALTAAAVYAGQVVLPDRAALAHQVAPVDGPARELMRLATERAGRRLAALIAAAARRRGATDDAPAVLAAGKVAVREALARAEDGDQLTDDEVAWLTLLLAHQSVRDFAWERVTPEHWQQTLWMYLLRRAEPGLVPAPASLLAFLAWRGGFGALAGVALERALEADPAYPMARVLDEVFRRGLPPSMLDNWPLVSRDAAQPVIEPVSTEDTNHPA